MIVSLEEMKKYLRVDFDDDDEFIKDSLIFSEKLCSDICRLSADEFAEMSSAKIAVMYSAAYLYEHREDADHRALTLSLRSLLFGDRREEF